MRPWVLALATTLFAPSALAQAGGGENNATRSGAVVIPRLGVLGAGSGDFETECEGSGAGEVCEGTGGESDYDDESRLLLGVDILGNVGGNFRLGGGIWFVPETQFEGDGGGNEVEYGSDLTLSFIAEGLIDLTPRVALAGRLFAGGLILFPGDDLEDGIDALEDSCNTIEAAGGDCEVKDGPYLGPTLGAGFGVVGAVGRVALRGDFMLQWYTIDLLGFEASGAGTEVDLATNASGLRFWLGFGVEI